MDFAELPKEGDNRIKIIQNGDLVLIYERHDSLDHIYMKSGEIYSNKFGTFYHDDIIGKHYGSRIQSRSKKGYIYVLKPTPELWSSAVYVSFLLSYYSSLFFYLLLSSSLFFFLLLLLYQSIYLLFHILLYLLF